MRLGDFIDLAGGWGNLIAWVINGGFAWVIWSLRRQFSTKEEVALLGQDLRGMIDAQDRRLVVVEHVVTDIPAKIDTLIERMAANEASLGGISNQIERLSQQVNMLLRHEMEDARK